MKLQIDKVQVKGREVLVRVDFNVPIKEGVITDDTRITAAIPTLNYLLENGAKVVVCSHLGRPGGQADAKYSLAPVAKHLGHLLSVEVGFAADCIGAEVMAMRAELKEGAILLLENVRFYPEETANDVEFARALAGAAEVYVNDAFGTAHRAHASTAGVTEFVATCAMGFLMGREVEYLGEKLRSPEKPFVVIMGGAKVSDKIEVMRSLIAKADVVLVGGAMAYTFQKALGREIGDSLVENDKLELALDLIEFAKKNGTELILPDDNVITEEIADDATTEVTEPFSAGGAIKPGWSGVDIGPKSIEEFKAQIAKAKTIVWNGPMGIFEMAPFANGTREIAEAVAQADALSILGGGDSVTAANKFGVDQRVTFLSTGGGASLEMLEGKELPGLAALDESDQD